jgi:hypothetical protein
MTALVESSGGYNRGVVLKGLFQLEGEQQSCSEMTGFRPGMERCCGCLGPLKAVFWFLPHQRFAWVGLRWCDG